MRPNMGASDRTLRLFAAAVLVGLSNILQLDGYLALVLPAIAVLFAITALTGRCPLYVPLGISTLREKRTASGEN